MRRPPTWSLLVLLSACDARISDVARDAASADAIDTDPASDAVIDAVRLGPWSPPLAVPPAATAATEDDVTLSSDGLELIFAIAASGSKDLYYTSRASRDAPWNLAAKLPFDSSFSEETPRFSPDDKTLYFSSDRAGNGNLDIYAVAHTAPGMSWGTVREIASVNTTTLVEKWFMPCANGRYVMVQTAGNATDLVEGVQGGGPPTPIDVLNTDATETGAFLTRDCLTIYFASNRTTPEQIYTSHRDAPTSPWLPPAPVVDFAALGGNQEDPWLSADGRIFAFASNAGGNKDIYISTR